MEFRFSSCRGDDSGIVRVAIRRSGRDPKALQVMGLSGDTIMTNDDSQMVSFSVAGVELVYGRGDLVGLAIVELTVSGVAMTLQGFQIRWAGPDRITVGLPAFKHPRDGQMKTAIVLPRELSDAISSTVAATFNSLARPTLSDAGIRGATALSHT